MDDELIAYWRAQKEDRQEERREQLDAAHAEMSATRTALAELGLTLEAKSDCHFHVLRIEGHKRTLVAQWWPSSGKTMDGQRRGQHCATGTALAAWLRDKQRADARRDGRSP